MPAKRFYSLTALPILLLSMALPATAETLSGQVVNVISGNTLVLAVAGNNLYRVHMSGVVAPAVDQLHGKDALTHAKMLLLGKTVRVEIIRHMDTGRVSGRITHGGADMNLRLLQAGLAGAQAYPGQSASERQRYRQAERKARQAGLGMWKSRHR